MKQFNKQDLPDSIEYNGKTFKLDSQASAWVSLDKPFYMKRGEHVQVNVLSRNLRGKTDLHGKPYQPHVFIFSTEYGKAIRTTDIKQVDNSPAVRKELARIKKFGYGT